MGKKIYSAYGHIKQLAEEELKGLKKAGVDAEIKVVPETLPEEVQKKMHIAKFDYPVATVDDLKNYDGYLFGFATRYGSAPAQFKAFLDATGQLWYTGALKGKVAGIFQSSAGSGGGQETPALTFLPHFAHHGIVYVPMGHHPHLSVLTEARGGSFWGAGTLAATDGSRQPSTLEKELAEYQGEQFGKFINRLQ
ncbi:hypothetical protein HDV06_005581 [Boothiomyces sp. JEL0866]|nr:hypothetical protein HDV06_005581 [Boothiomyces sp. JEL0866]